MSEPGNTRIIEILGPPGAGKSTVYKRLCRTWNKKSNWIYQDQLLLMDLPPVSSPRLWMEYQLRKILGLNGNKNLHIDFGLRFANDNKELCQFLWDQLCDSNVYSNEDVDKKFRSAFFLFKDFSRYQAIWEQKSSLPCIIDEGLFVKSFFASRDLKDITELVDQYVQIRTLPQAVIYINTDQTETIVDRLVTRKKTIASHHGKGRNELLTDIEKWQFYFNSIVNKLEHLGIPVLYVDGLKTVNENVILINQSLKKGFPEINSLVPAIARTK